MGKPGAVDDPEVTQAIDEVRLVASEAGKAIGIFGMKPEALSKPIAQGYTLLAVGIDTMFLGNGAKAALRELT